MKKISAVMCTYGRFSCVERAMNCFLAQTYPNKELIIYNTDAANGYNPSLNYGASSVPNFNITIVNCGMDSITQKPYTNVGAIRRDALMFASGDYVVTWDDDDVFYLTLCNKLLMVWSVLHYHFTNLSNHFFTAVTIYVS